MERGHEGRVSVSVFPSFRQVTPDISKNNPVLSTSPPPGPPVDANILPSKTKGKKIVIKDKLNTAQRVVIFASEFVATFILVFLGCMGCVASITGGPIPHEQISFTFGLAVMISVQCFGHISGSHINPVVTVASAIMGYTPLVQVPIYILGQFAGAIAGYGAVMGVTPSKHLGNKLINTTAGLVKQAGVCSPGVNPEITAFQGVVVEFILSLLLVLVCCGVWDHRNSTRHDSTAIRFGLAIAVLAMAGGPYTGANMNPARSFGPALLNGDWAHHWVYWVGPLGAAVVGSTFYRFVFQTPEPEKIEGPESIALNDKA